MTHWINGDWGLSPLSNPAQDEASKLVVAA
jgi:hypothetical protein